jgi:hypothetical protein
LLAVFDTLPKFIIYDAKGWNILDDPFCLGVYAGLASAGLWIFNEALSVPDK